jgi:hypothetical protein
METLYEKIKTIVAGSEVSLLNEQIWQQHKTIMFLEERVSAFERMMHAYTKVTMDLAKEVRFQINLAGMRTTPRKRYGRSATEVSKRWAEWKALDEAGMPPSQIANRYKVDKATIRYAKQKGWVNTPYKPYAKSSVPASLIGHELVSLPPTRKGPRKNKTDLRLAA